MSTSLSLSELDRQLKGELLQDDLSRRIYATDASIYREVPMAVAVPADAADLGVLVRFAHQNGIPLIPRASGTSLAGQCVGNGLVVDITYSFSDILEVNEEDRWVRVQPGLIRDELNRYLQPFGLYFGPNTSTSNRATIGGMIGNNSCGSTSIEYGTTRDHLLEAKVLLSDGTETVFRPLSVPEFEEKCDSEGLEGDIYRHLRSRLADPTRQQAIRDHFPRPEVARRNTGYALDLLLAQQPFDPAGEPFNACTILCGSEGTLALVTEVKLQLDPLPPPHNVVLAAHFDSVSGALEATLLAMKQRPSSCELMDKVILDCTRSNREQEKNRFFLEGDPEAVLMVEFKGENPREAESKAKALIEGLERENLGYAYPLIPSPGSKRVWDLRKAGLGLLSNMQGDAKPVACIEDTAVSLEDLPAYIDEFEALMRSFGQQAVYYAHAGAGELHLRPILNLKTAEGQQHLQEISRASAALVKKYGGSLSGEHGDGRVRAEFIPFMLGKENYELLREIKRVWDPKGILNPGKIVDAPPMASSLRYRPGQLTRELDTAMDFSPEGGLLRLAEKCNGSGDCRKLPSAGGTMCPSFHATRQEKDTTRARANALREYLSFNQDAGSFHRQELGEVLDLCLSCKACASECPSSVDMAALKAEWQYQQYQLFQPDLRDRVFASIGQIQKTGSLFPGLANFFLGQFPFGFWNKRLLNIAPERSLPKLSRMELLKWWKKKGIKGKASEPVKGEVILYADEFTRFGEAEIGIQAVALLRRLGYEVQMPDAPFSGRAHISKGFLKEARNLAERNVSMFHLLAREDRPLLGIEPSAILGFRDEFPRLLRGEWQEKARALSSHTLLIEEFLIRELRAGRIGPRDFPGVPKHILLHGHCHQKALADFESLIELLSLPEQNHVEVIPSGCCGMAGSFGYEKEHYELSMKIGELVLFPAVRNAGPDQIIVAPGTSCRHQIRDGTGHQALHPVEVL